MTTSRRRTSGTDVSSELDSESRADETPELNVYEIHSDRTVLTEPDNADGWIAAAETVTPPR